MLLPSSAAAGCIVGNFQYKRWTGNLHGCSGKFKRQGIICQAMNNLKIKFLPYFRYINTRIVMKMLHYRFAGLIFGDNMETLELYSSANYGGYVESLSPHIHVTTDPDIRDVPKYARQLRKSKTFVFTF